MTQVYIIHGYTANGDKHWFPWLERELTALGIACYRLTMPNSHRPVASEWLAELEQRIDLNQPTIIVGHSLGTLATLNFLAKTRAKIIGTVLVSGFYQPLPNLPELDDFAKLHQKLTACEPLPAQQAVVISAKDDKVVAPVFSQALANYLKADFYLLPEGGHFLDREGITELPLVLESLKKWL